MKNITETEILNDATDINSSTDLKNKINESMKSSNLYIYKKGERVSQNAIFMHWNDIKLKMIKLIEKDTSNKIILLKNHTLPVAGMLIFNSLLYSNHYRKTFKLVSLYKKITTMGVIFSSLSILPYFYYSNWDRIQKYYCETKTMSLRRNAILLSGNVLFPLMPAYAMSFSLSHILFTLKLPPISEVKQCANFVFNTSTSIYKKLVYISLPINILFVLMYHYRMNYEISHLHAKTFTKLLDHQY
ncbi:hypothetical protein A3Q56_01815 [Intoshia linei]|uniref:Uncharacterized protein n=1 Tax=Intoshia linei TaxID=1819745 RepID=A0A177B813_9BILA|nr:hypothetical protein A3Q56_01815 [Intoshia linei]